MRAALLVAIDAAAWVGLSAAVGVAAALVPDPWLDRDTALTRIRPWEAGGRTYGRWLRVHRWKDRLPEVNGLGPGERMSKSRLAGRGSLPVLARETRRAEYVHLAVAACGPLFLLWNPLALGIVMIAAGLAFNAPFVVVQRYNRARIAALTGRPGSPAARPHPGGPTR